MLIQLRDYNASPKFHQFCDGKKVLEALSQLCEETIHNKLGIIETSLFQFGKVRTSVLLLSAEF